MGRASRPQAKVGTKGRDLRDNLSENMAGKAERGTEMFAEDAETNLGTHRTRYVSLLLATGSERGKQMADRGGVEQRKGKGRVLYAPVETRLRLEVHSVSGRKRRAELSKETCMEHQSHTPKKRQGDRPCWK